MSTPSICVAIQIVNEIGYIVVKTHSLHLQMILVIIIMGHRNRIVFVWISLLDLGVEHLQRYFVVHHPLDTPLRRPGELIILTDSCFLCVQYHLRG